MKDQKDQKIVSSVKGILKKNLSEESALREGSDNNIDLKQIREILSPSEAKPEGIEAYDCQIIHLFVRDPVTAADGEMYEREVIEEWLRNNDTSPVTKERLSNKSLFPITVFVQKQMTQFLEKNPKLKDSRNRYLPQKWIAELKKACQSGDEKTIADLAVRDPRLLVFAFSPAVFPLRDIGDFSGKTALHFAAVGHPSALNLILDLLEKRVPGLALEALYRPDGSGYLPLHCAIAENKPAEMLLQLCRWMAPRLKSVAPPPQWRLPEQHSELNRALEQSIVQKNLPQLSCLLRLGANANAKNAEEKTLLYLSVETSSFDILSGLLESKADPNQRNDRIDDTVLHYTVRQNQPRKIALLIKKGAKRDQVLKDGSSPWHIAAERKDTAAAIALLGEEKQISSIEREVQDNQGRTPLHRAVISGSLDMMKWLLEQKANIHAIDHEGKTVLHLAASNNRVDILKVLREKGALLTSTDQAGNTALHSAAYAGASKAAEYLLELEPGGLSPDVKNVAGKTPRQCAEINRHTVFLIHYDKITSELAQKEERELLSHATLGAFLLKQQQVIRNQQRRIEELEAQLKAQEEDKIKPLTDFFHHSKQDPLIVACERGDFKLVKSLIDSKKVTSFFPNAEGKQPLGAAIWGMNPEIVSYVLEDIEKNKKTPMTWAACQAHNRQHYASVFIVDRLNLSTNKDWYGFLGKIKKNEFVRTIHLNQINAQLGGGWSWEQLYVTIASLIQSYPNNQAGYASYHGQWPNIQARTEAEYLKYRTQITQAVVTSIPQEALIIACEQGDIKAVSALIEAKKANSYTPNLDDKHPLGAAVWGSNPEVVKYLLKDMEENKKTAMTWSACQAHNRQHYSNVFMVDELKNVSNNQLWYVFSEKIKENAFVKTIHLNQINAYIGQGWSWEQFSSTIATWMQSYPSHLPGYSSYHGSWSNIQLRTEAEYAKHRMEISQVMMTSSPQEALILACEQGNIKAVRSLIEEKKATSYSLKADEKQPLGAAIWGMNPEVVNYVLADLKKHGKDIMSWETCQRHNQTHYQEMFMVNSFSIATNQQWHVFLEKITLSPFVRNLHLKQITTYIISGWSWEQLCSSVAGWSQSYPSNQPGYPSYHGSWYNAQANTESAYATYRNQISQAVQQAAQSAIIAPTFSPS